MLDFNDQEPAAPSPSENSERDELRSALMARLEGVLFALFPAGKVTHGKFVVGDVLGSPGRSLEIELDGERAGLWIDRATGNGGDVFALIAAHRHWDTHRDFAAVLGFARELLGRAPAVSPAKRKASVPVDELGPATAKWDYLAADGSLIAIVYRYDPPGGKKEFRPWDVRRRKMAPPDPRPLYNQPGMKDAAQVILVEGEKCAQALINAGVTSTTAMHGANAPVDKTDWSPLSGKAVLIWPDRDKPGWEYAAQAAQAILSAGAKSCHVLYPPEDAAEGWDAADAITEGFDIATFLSHGPRLQMHDITDDTEPAVSSDESVWGTEDALALAFTRRYHRDWQYVATWGRWLVWDGHRWRNEDTLAATDLIRSVCRHAAVHADTPISRPGDVWELGNHRLVCGDATDPKSYELLMADAQADMVFTDPPYNVDYANSAKDKMRGKDRPILNDNLGDGFYDFLLAALTPMLGRCSGATYIAMSSSELDTLQQAFRAAGGKWSTFIIWAKNTFTLVVRGITENLRGEFMTGVRVLCSPSFFAKLTGHAKVEKAYENYAQGAMLRDDVRNGFAFGGIVFEEYLGKASYLDGAGTAQTRDFIAEGEAHAFPLGTVDTFATYFAPADFNETVNTLGQAIYAKQEPRKFDRGTDLHTQSNPLPMCHRPGVLVKLTMA